MALVSELITELKLEATKYKAELAAAKAETSSFSSLASSAMLGVGAAFAVATVAAGLLYHELDRQIEKVEELARSAQKLGISFDSFQSLKFAADQVGVSMDSLKAGFGRMSSFVNAANEGTAKNIQLLKSLGLSAKELASLSIDKQFEAIATAISHVQNTTQQRADVKSIFGRGGLENIALIKSDIKSAREEYEGFNIAITEGQAEQTEAFVKTKRVVGTLFEGFMEQVGADVAPAFTALAQSLVKSITGFGDLRAVARSVAADIVSGIIGMEKGFEILTSVLDSVIDRLHQMSNIIPAVASRASILYNAIKDGTLDPRVTGTVDDGYDHKPSTLSGHTLNSQNQLQSIKSSLVAQLDSFIAPLPERFQKVGDATTELAHTMKRGKKTLDDLFGGGANQGINYLQSILTKIPQAHDSTFNDLANEVRDGLVNNTISQGRIESDIAVMQKIAQDSGGEHIGKWNGHSYDTYTDSNSGMLAAVKELQQYVKDKKEKTPEVKLSVEASKDFIIKVANDSYTQSSMAKVVLSIAEKEAINTTT